MGLTINGTEYEKKTAVIEIPVTAAEGAISKTIAYSGDAHIHSYWMDLPDWTNVIATNFRINTAEGKVFDSGDLVANEGTEFTGTVDRIVDETAGGGATIEVYLSGDTGDAATVKIQLFFDFDPKREIYSD